MKIYFYTLLAAATMLAGCSQTETLDTDNAALREIRLGATVEKITATPRSPQVDFTNFTTKVMLSNATGNYATSTLNYAGTVAFTNEVTEARFEVPQYFPADGSDVYLCGLFPSDVIPGHSWTIDCNESTSASYVFNGKEDVMAAAEVSSNKETGQGGTYPTLTFCHLLTNLVVVVKAEDAAAAEKWGKLQSISLVDNLKNTVTVDLKSGAATVDQFTGTTAPGFWQASDNETGESKYKFTNDLFESIAIPSDKAQAVAYSMMAPLSYTNDKAHFTLNVKTTTSSAPGVNVAVQLSKAGSEVTTQGKICVVTLTFKATTINMKATISPWEDGGSHDLDIQ